MRLLILAFYNKENRTVRKYRVSARELIWRLLRIALPVTLGSLVLSLTNFIDLTLVMRGLQSGGMDAESANRLYGNYSSLAVPIFNMPSVFVMPIAYALVPLVTKARIAGNTQAQHMVAYNSLKAAGIVSMPFVFGMVLLSRPILLLLFERNAALRAAPLLSLLGPSVFFMGIVVITTSLLQACGKAGLPVWSMACGAVCKLVVSAVCIPKIGMMGAPIGTLGCYVVIAGMNVCFAVRYCELKLQVMNRFWSALVAGFGCALVGRLVYTLGTSAMGFRVSAFLSIVSSALVYGFVLFALGGIDCEDLEALPMPKVLKRLLGRFLFKKERKMHCENCFGVDKPTSLRL